MGGVGGVGNMGGTPPLNTEHTITLFGKAFGLFGQHGLFLTQGGTYDVSVIVLFLVIDAVVGRRPNLRVWICPKWDSWDIPNSN